RLDPDARSILRTAAVSGHEFTLDLLRHTLRDDAGSRASLDESLERLRAAGLIHQTSVLPAATYQFRHILTREVAYDSLLQHQRRRMHGLVGQAIEECFAAHLEEYAEVLAHHFAEAKDWRKAAHHSRVAAERSYRLGQLPETLAFVEQARNALDQLPEDTGRQAMIIDLLLRRERVCESLAAHEEQQAAI